MPRHMTAPPAKELNSRARGAHRVRGTNVFQPRSRSDLTTSTEADQESMIWIPGGSFLMGSNEFYREERPMRRETVQGFWIDRYPVTNADFRKFIGATGYVTNCERPPDPAMYPDPDPSPFVPASS